MALTKHGYHIYGTPLDDLPDTNSGCGGPDRCGECHDDVVVYENTPDLFLAGNPKEARIKGWPASGPIVDDESAEAAIQESKVIVTAGQLAITKNNLDALLSEVIRPMIGHAKESTEKLQALYHFSYETMMASQSYLEAFRSAEQGVAMDEAIQL